MYKWSNNKIGTITNQKKNPGIFSNNKYRYQFRYRLLWKLKKSFGKVPVPIFSNELWILQITHIEHLLDISPRICTNSTNNISSVGNGKWGWMLTKGWFTRYYSCWHANWRTRQQNKNICLTGNLAMISDGVLMPTGFPHQ